MADTFGYVTFYRGKRWEVHSDTAYHAQQAAVEHFQQGQRRIVKGYDITVILAEKNDEVVAHSGAELD